MTLNQEKAEDLVALVRQRFPNWAGFSDPQFMDNEVTYKQDAIAKARDLLGEPELRRLMAEGQFDEFIGRLDSVGKSLNLLYLRVPSSGDLAILYQEELEKPSFCEAIIDLLYGADASEHRLARYVEYVEAHELPNKWTFPTYFLFICHPETEMFVKPRTMRWFLAFIEGPKLSYGPPVPEVYAAIKRSAHELVDELQSYGPRDMVDIQGLIWVAYRESQEEQEIVTKGKRTQFAKLFEEFAATYPQSEDGQWHIGMYDETRQVARGNIVELTAASERGADITEAVLFKLLPYADTAENRDRGRWVTFARAFTTDIRLKFEAAGWTRAEDWPKVAQALLHFVRRCNENPQALAEACAEFSALPYSKGFQTGTMTPILNALRPDDFVLINDKSRRGVNHFAGTNCSQKLTDYPATNATALALIEELADEMHEYDVPDLLDTDLFDMFCHWLVAVKKFEFRTVRYWKIAPGENAWNWGACREGGFIAIGWDELGDVSGLSRKEFDARRDKAAAAHDGWTKPGADQVWTFAHIDEGDRIVANRGTTEVLGIGTVAGPYYFVDGQRHGHRLPVEWDALGSRMVDEYGWRRTLVGLDREKFEAICGVPPMQVQTDLAEPFATIFTSTEEAEWAFGLLKEALNRLDVEGSEDKRFALTLRHNRQVLRLTFGNWAILQFCAPVYSRYRVALALMDEEAHMEEKHRLWGPFASAQGDPSISVYELPIESVRPWQGDIHKTYESTFAHLADRFRHWEASTVRKFSQSEIAEAVFDPNKRARLLTEGPGLEEIVLIGPDQVAEDGYFTLKTFELLSDLHATPTKDVYLAHKEEFKTQLEQPFQQLLRDVATRLPSQITAVMETEQRLFSRILKNDFGRGGAWDFYWGAFYPKGSKRTEGAQLILTINHERLIAGFSIGDYGVAQRRRFLQNCQENYEALEKLLQDALSDECIVHARHDDIETDPDGTVTVLTDLTWQDWLRHPDQANFNASVVLPMRVLLGYTAQHLSEYITLAFKRLFPLILLTVTDDPVSAISDYLDTSDIESKVNPEYDLTRFAEEAGFDAQELERWVRAIERKKQVILYGPPGTGKTFAAEKLALHLIGGGDGFSDLVQFHPAYAYEDFIQGIRPRSREGGGLEYPVVPGRFLEFCKEAGKRKGTCVLIIDEINRANLARVFGELMYLLEYRDREIPLAGGGVLSIPPKVRIIGTMNTADRSIALVDHALRRRFAFLALYPNYDILRHYHRTTGFDVEPLISVLKRLNRRIGEPHYEVGITFFLREDLEEQLEDIWRMEIEPYLEEYFFDQKSEIDKFRWNQVKKDVFP